MSLPFVAVSIETKASVNLTATKYHDIIKKLNICTKCSSEF